MKIDRARLERLLGGEALAGLRARLARQCLSGASERAFTLGQLTAAERETLQGLLGRAPRATSSMRLSVQALSDALARARIAPDLHAALETLDGALVDARAARAAQTRAWESVFGAAPHPQLAGLLTRAAGRGLVKRLAAAEPRQARRLLAQAAAVLARLPATGMPLAQLAAQTVGDAHALDGGRPVATLVLAAAAVDEVPDAEGETRARNRWARLGVTVSELARPALTLNLPALAESPAGRLCAAARRGGEPVHLSLRVLLRAPPVWDVAGRRVYVCENPSVIAVAADRLGADAPPMVCTEGMPAAAQRTLLSQLARAGAALCYHGDYDWDGLRIANFVMTSFGARPWCFDADHYRPHGGRHLTGAPVPACWDAGLADKMEKAGRALEEEAVVEELLEDLHRGPARDGGFSETIN